MDWSRERDTLLLSHRHRCAARPPPALYLGGAHERLSRVGAAGDNNTQVSPHAHVFCQNPEAALIYRAVHARDNTNQHNTASGLWNISIISLSFRNMIQIVLLIY